jgi:ribulose-phosphate 3-epimerase
VVAGQGVADDIIVHFDIMDGKFVKNAGVDLSFIEKVKKAGMYADTHLMVSNPIEDGYIDNAIKYGSDNITIHYEIKILQK